jgi:nucleoside-diphosphate-sugar epimerase
MGENIAVSWMHQYSLPALIVRPFHTYGPGMALDDGRVYADFIADIVANRDIKLNSDGSAIRAFCYIADASVAFFTVLLKGEPGQAYNVGNRNGESSILQLANLLTGMYPEKNLTVIRFESQEAGYIKSVVSKIVPDTEKIRKLGWNASFNLEKGFDRTIKSYA